MSYSDGLNLLSFVIGLVIGGMVAAVIVMAVCNDDMSDVRKEAIERDYAQYNPKTSEWEWIEPEKGTE